MNISNRSKQLENSQEITPKQAHTLGVITTLIRRNPDVSPTLTEIAHCLNVKKQTVSQLLVILQSKGYITRPRGSKRAIQLTNKELPYSTQKGRAA